MLWRLILHRILNFSSKGFSAMEFTFSTTDVDTSDNYGLLPKGDYIACAVAAEVKTTKSGEGQFLEVRFQILEGSYKGRTIFDRYIFKNPSAEAEKIGKQQLARFLEAIGKQHIRDTQEVLDIPLVLSIGTTTRKDNGEDTNRVVKYSKSSPVASYTQQQPQSPQVNNKPW